MLSKRTAMTGVAQNYLVLRSDPSSHERISAPPISIPEMTGKRLDDHYEQCSIPRKSPSVSGGVHQCDPRRPALAASSGTTAPPAGARRRCRQPLSIGDCRGGTSSTSDSHLPWQYSGNCRVFIHQHQGYNERAIGGAYPEVLLETDGVLSISKMSRQSARYIISGQESFLDLYASRWPAFPVAWRAWRSLRRQSRPQQRIAAFRALVDKRIDEEVPSCRCPTVQPYNSRGRAQRIGWGNPLWTKSRDGTRPA